LLPRPEAACQLMLHRPLVVATLMGAIFGTCRRRPRSGRARADLPGPFSPWGPRSLPTTRARPCSRFRPARIASSSIGLDAGVSPPSCCSPVVVAEAGKAADRFVRKVNVRIARITAESVDRGDMQAVEHGLLAGLTLFAVVGMALALVFSGAGVAVSKELLPVRPASRGASRPPAGASAPGRRPPSTRAPPRSGPAAVFFLTMAAVFGGTVLFRWTT